MRGTKRAILLLLLVSPVLLLAQDDDKLNAARREEKLSPAQTAAQKVQADLQQKIAELEARVEELEKERTKTEQRSELEELLQEAETAALRAESAEKTPAAKAFAGGERQQQALNPNLSATGDFIGHFSSLEAADHDAGNHGHGEIAGRQFMLREAEFHIISNLDPYTRAKFFLGIPGLGSLHVGEAYMEWVNLPANMGLKIGKYRTQFGVLNRWHAHGLPQVDRPRVLTQFLGEGLSGFGAATNVLLPGLWSHVNELDVELIYGGDGISFTSEGHKQWVVVGHLKNYYDLTSNAYLELGFSGAYGNNHPEGELQTILGGVDLTYKWVPANRSKYRTFEFRNELIISRREKPGGNMNSLGFYSYIENKLDARWWAGIRFDYTQQPEASEEHLWGLTPCLTYWQSEFVLLRLQYSHFKPAHGKNEEAIMLQSVWSMGPHKHEAY